MRKSIRVAVLAMALALPGCATPYRNYDGPELAPEKVAALVSSQAAATRGLLSDKLGIPLLGTAKVFVSSPLAVEFVAEAGHRYFLGGRVESTTSGFQWYPVLVDETTNTLIRPRR